LTSSEKGICDYYYAERHSSTVCTGTVTNTALHVLL
jgi:hypothetical protein